MLVAVGEFAVPLTRNVERRLAKIASICRVAIEALELDIISKLKEVLGRI
jgi:hypothetical protein